MRKSKLMYEFMRDLCKKSKKNGKPQILGQIQPNIFQNIGTNE